MQYIIDSYPQCTETARNWLSKLLNVFLDNILNLDVHKLSLGSVCLSLKCSCAIIVWSWIDHVSGRKTIVNIFHTLGFSVSYDEIPSFKQSVVQCEDQDYLLSSKLFYSVAADSVDHNIETINGLPSFHGMDIISMSNPYSTSRNSVVPGMFGDKPITQQSCTRVANVICSIKISIVSCNIQQSELSLLLVWWFLVQQAGFTVSFWMVLSNWRQSKACIGWFHAWIEHSCAGCELQVCFSYSYVTSYGWES